MGHTDLLQHSARCSSCGSAKHAACPPCETQTPLRNNYFFGKLMDVPDFDVEQLYVVEKFRRHHARLHGVGVVCGLELVEHTNPACRDRYVIVKPGSALDCCGNEILVIDDDLIDLQSFAAVKALAQNPDQKDHLLQICIRYRECPTEEVPVLYDECGCDDTRCAPNRILETYAFDVLVDPALPTPPQVNAPGLTWQATLALSGAQAIAVHHPTLRLYVAADQSPSGGLVQQYHLATLAPLAPRTFATRVLAIATNADGKKLFVAVAGAAAADPAQFHTLDTTSSAAFSTGATSPVDIPSSAGASSVAIRLLPDGSLVTLAVNGAGTSTEVQVWDTTGAAPAVAAGKLTTAAAKLISPSPGSNGRLYAAATSGAVHHFDTSVAALDPQNTPVASANVVDFAVGTSTGPDVLIWIESTGKQLRQAQLDGTNIKSVTLSDAPVALSVMEGARTALVLVQGTTNASVQSVDLHRLITSTTNLLGPALPIGPGGKSIALDDKVFASYADGVAVLDLDAMDCGASLLPHACPACDTADCIVLATIAGYRPGFKLQNVSDPASDPLADSAAQIARLDNLTGRTVIPSAADLAAAIRCLLQHEGGGEGPQGPVGPTGSTGGTGPAGPGIDAVTAQFVDCTQPGSATLVGTTLDLVIPRGCDGVDGAAGAAGVGLDWDLPHICDISWKHNDVNKLADIQRTKGLIVGFDTKIVGTDLDVNSIEVQVQRPDDQLDTLVQCWCDLNLNDRIDRGQVKACDIRSFQSGLDGDGFATGVRIQLDLERLLALGNGRVKLRVVINGDFIRGLHHKNVKELRALDADHLPKVEPPSPPNPPQPGVTPEWIKTGDKRFSGDGVEGGTFLSWFDVAG